MLLLLLLLINGSQHALAVLVEVNKEERSVLLPCLYSSFIPEDPTVTWTRSDLDPKSVHLRGGGGDDLRGQNRRYSNRTSLSPYALITKDFSLTLRKPQLTDSGNYTCSISAGGQERRLRDIQLQVKDQQVEVKVKEGSESVILPCKTEPDLPDDTRVEWTRSDLGIMTVHVYTKRNEHLSTQDDLYTDRTKMNEDPLRTGDLSLTLKLPTERDTGGYICTIYRNKDILRQKVVLQVKEPFPSWATVLIVLLVLLVLLVVSGGLLFHFRQCFMSGYKVVVESGVESVQLPCKTIVHLPKGTKVEWKDGDSRKVHVYQSSSDQPEEQHDFYRGRTKMERNLLKPGDLSLTLKLPTDGDSNTYTCTAYNKRGNILMGKQVQLTVRVPQVQVDSGVESVLLPFKATVPFPKDANVEWTNSSHRKVHVRQNGSEQPDQQFEFYRDRTKMNEDMQRTGDLSLTLKHPTDWDIKTYTCTAYSREGTILMQKQVELKVRVCQVEVEEGVESVQLPFRTTQNLPRGSEVIWWDSADRKVHVYQNGSDRPKEQHQDYRDRTKMNEDLLKTGDLSLTLRRPTDGDSETYRCKVYGEIRRYKKVQLTVKVCQVEVEEGAESVQLPFRTTGNLPEDAEVEWERIEPEPIIHVHVYQSGSDQPEEQHQDYRDRTKMNEDLLKTGDLSLTLRRPTERDSGRYRCGVYGKIRRYKKVQLTVKGRAQVQDQTGIIRNRSSSIDPTPLMADQSV